MRKLFVMIAVLSQVALSAGWHDWCQLDCFYVGGEAKFLRACVQDTYFVIQQPPGTPANSVIGSAFGVQPDYESGFAVWLGAETGACCTSVELRYDYLRNTDSRRITGAGLIPLKLSTPLIQPTSYTGIARSIISVNYDSVDLQSRTPFWCCGRLSASMIGGLRWARIWFEEQAAYVATVAPPINSLRIVNSRAWGVGPRVGTDGQIAICGGLSATGELTAGVLLGEIRHRNKQGSAIGTSSFNVSFKDTCNALPLIEWKLGLAYDYCICGTLITLAGGFQSTQYWSALMNSNVLQQLDDEDDTRVNKVNIVNLDLNLYGFYVGLQATF